MNKKAKGIASLIGIIIIIFSALSVSFYLGGGITGNVAKDLMSKEEIEIKIIYDLSQLNEGWYEIRNGYVYYLEHFDSYIPLYAKIADKKYLNGMLVVSSDGSYSFDSSWQGLYEKEDYEVEDSNLITGQVTGMESVSGMQSASSAPPQLPWTNTASITLSSGTMTPTSVPGVWRSSGGNFYNSDGYRVTEDGGRFLDANGAVTNNRANAAVHSLAQEFRTIISATSGSPAPASAQPPTSAQASPQTPTSTQSQVKTYTVTIRDSSRRTFTITETGISENEVRVKLNRPGITISRISETRVTQPAAPSDKWIPGEKIGSSDTVVRGTQTRIVEQGLTPEEMAGRLNTQDKIDRVYNNWLASSGLTKSPESMSVFVEAIRNDLDQELFQSLTSVSPDFVSSYLGVSPATQATATATNLPYREIPGTNYINVNGRIITNQQEITRIKNEAQLRAALTALGGGQILGVDKEGRSVARKGNDIFVLNTGTGKFDPLEGVFYTLAETIERANDQITIVRRYRSSTKNLIETSIIDGEGYIYPIDEKTVALIKSNRAAGGTESVRYIGGVDPIANELILLDKDGKIIFRRTDIYSDSPEGIFGIRIEQNFAENGEPLSITTTSEDGKTTIQERKEQVIIDGQVITRTIDWVREHQENGRDLITRRTFETDKNTNLPTGQYSEMTQDKKTGEPLYLRIVAATQYFGYESKQTQGGGNFKTSILIDLKTGAVKINLLDKNGNVIEDLRSISIGGRNVQLNYKNLEELKNSEFWKNLPEFTKQDLERQSKEHAKWTSRKAFANIERVFTEFRGLGYYATLFFDDDYLLEWRNNVDKAFATLYLGTEYWSSDICGKYIDSESEGVAFAETPQGLLQVGAHVEATRTQAIINSTPIPAEETSRLAIPRNTPSDSRASYIYRITFAVRNGDYENDLRAPEELKFNVVIKGGEGQGNVLNRKVVELFRRDINISRGGIFSRSGQTAIVQESTAIYSEICLEFKSEMPSRWKNIKDNQLCTPVQISSGAPTRLRYAATTQSAISDLNDF